MQCLDLYSYDDMSDHKEWIRCVALLVDGRMPPSAQPAKVMIPSMPQCPHLHFLQLPATSETFVVTCCVFIGCFTNDCTGAFFSAIVCLKHSYGDAKTIVTFSLVFGYRVISSEIPANLIPQFS